MTSIEIEKSSSIRETPEQFLAGEAVSAELEYQLGRACTAHCFGFTRQELSSANATSVEELIEFVTAYGASSGSGLYREGVGWNIIALADLLRIEGFQVTSQNLKISHGDFAINQAAQSGRVRSQQEKTRLSLYAYAGGTDRQKWILPMRDTILAGGQVVSSIQIPLLSGGFGPHSVAVTGLDEKNERITYFDPDHYNVKRYGEHPPAIERIDPRALIYERPLDEHLSVMTGETAHIFPPCPS